MSKQEFQKRIPLEHVDKIKSSVKNWNKIQVTIKVESKFNELFEVSGEFPTYVSKIDQEKLKDIDIRVGDNIISINDQNVSRASVKSVCKILKSANLINMILYRPDKYSLNKLLNTNKSEDLKNQNKFNSFFNLFKANISNKACESINKKSLLTCIGFGSLINKNKLQSNIQINKNLYENNLIETKQQEIIIDSKSDCGYYSIPRTETISCANSNFSSTSDLCSSAASSTRDNNFLNSQFLNEIEQFLNNIQKAIDNYVRPSIMFKILSIDESLVLYQNIEKLIPATKFLFNIISTLDLNSNKYPNPESLKIVFDSFKIYLNGIPKSISLLGDLACSNDKFAKFVENLRETVSFKIMDFLFMPLKFVQVTIDYLRQISDENSNNKLDDLIKDLYDCVIETCSILEDKYDTKFLKKVEEIETTQSITNVSDYTDFLSFSDSNESCEPIKIMMRSDKSEKWFQACLNLEENCILFCDSIINLKMLKNLKKSQNTDVIYIQLINQEMNQEFYAIQFDNELMLDYVYEKLNYQF